MTWIKHILATYSFARVAISNKPTSFTICWLTSISHGTGCLGLRVGCPIAFVSVIFGCLLGIMELRVVLVACCSSSFSHLTPKTNWTPWTWRDLLFARVCWRRLGVWVSRRTNSNHVLRLTGGLNRSLPPITAPIRRKPARQPSPIQKRQSIKLIIVLELRRKIETQTNSTSISSQSTESVSNGSIHLNIILVPFGTVG